MQLMFDLAVQSILMKISNPFAFTFGLSDSLFIPLFPYSRWLYIINMIVGVTTILYRTAKMFAFVVY